MFDNLDFKTVTTTGRGVSNDPVSIVHSHKTKKNEILFRLAREAMDKCGFVYGEKVHVQFAADNSVCRIIKSTKSGSVTLSQQVKDNPNSAGVVRLTYKSTLPDFLGKESRADNKKYNRVRYVHEDDKIQYDKDMITFQLSRVEADEEKK
ncbi:hypothetical protein J7X56_004595 [Vibrio parahaemolyticus]|nr:hypothetical protein [Vibrio parahaemolyticus]